VRANVRILEAARAAACRTPRSFAAGSAADSVAAGSIIAAGAREVSDCSIARAVGRRSLLLRIGVESGAVDELRQAHETERLAAAAREPLPPQG
jgi:hypothetical protein